MKSIVLTLLGIISFSFSLGAQKQGVNSDVQSGKKILVAYFSCTGTTEKVANAIVEVTGGKPYKITPADPIPQPILIGRIIIVEVLERCQMNNRVLY